MHRFDLFLYINIWRWQVPTLVSGNIITKSRDWLIFWLCTIYFLGIRSLRGDAVSTYFSFIDIILILSFLQVIIFCVFLCCIWHRSQLRTLTMRIKNNGLDLLIFVNNHFNIITLVWLWQVFMMQIQRDCFITKYAILSLNTPVCFRELIFFFT